MSYTTEQKNNAIILIGEYGSANISVQLYEDLEKIPEIIRLSYTTGNYSMFLEIVCKDINQLRRVLHDELQKIKGIERTETIISLDDGFCRNVQVAPAD